MAHAEASDPLVPAHPTRGSATAMAHAIPGRILRICAGLHLEGERATCGPGSGATGRRARLDRRFRIGQRVFAPGSSRHTISTQKLALRLADDRAEAQVWPGFAR